MKPFEEEEDYYNPVRIGNFWNDNYIAYEIKGDRSKNLSLNEYTDKIKPYLKVLQLIFKNLTHGKSN